MGRTFYTSDVDGTKSKRPDENRQWPAWSGSKEAAVPLEEQLYERRGAGVGPVGGQEDPAVVQVLAAAAVQEVTYEQVQCGGLETPHLTGPVLDKTAAGARLAGARRGRVRLPAQRHPVHDAVLLLLTPLLHWILEKKNQQKTQSSIGWGMTVKNPKTKKYRVTCSNMDRVMFAVTTEGSEGELSKQK